MAPNLNTISGLYGACALIYLVITLLVLARGPRGPTAWALAGACLSTVAWAAIVAVQSAAPMGGLAAWLELVRSTAWYWFLVHLYRTSIQGKRARSWLFTIAGLAVVLLVCVLPLVALVHPLGPSTLWSVHMAVRIGLPVFGILLLENLYYNTPIDQRWHLNMLCTALGAIFLFDFVLYADAVLFQRISLPLFEARAPVVALAAPLLAIAAARNRRWRIDIHVSRDIVFHSATLIIAGACLLAFATAGELVRRGIAGWGHIIESSVIFGGMMTVIVLLTSGSVRARLRSFLFEHFFTFRYDYRREWMRCIETLTAPDTHVGLHVRAIRTVANVVDSPAGVLFVRAPDEVAFHWAGSWNLPAITDAIPPGHPVIPAFNDGDRIVVLDEVAGSDRWFEDLPRAWLVVPLNHFGTVIGFVVLARSRGPFKLDREAFDLLRVVGREVASRVAEQRASQVLAQTHELREYSQRFAFVIHDIKNVSGQLSMLLANAEVHAANPAFQRDMLTTVRASVDKITRLLTRLQADRHERKHALLSPADRLRALVEALPVRAGDVRLIDHGHGAGAAIDPDSFDAITAHLLNNALEAGGASGTVTIAIRPETTYLVIDIIDQGPGMSPEFVRDTLFRPFSSTKDGGHGIGAYQARELLRAAGGDLLVLSREGVGTTMRILLPAVSIGVPGTQPTLA